MKRSKYIRNAGFTFIEVLVAMLIFVMAVVASLSVTDGSVRATREAKEISTATWLLQNVMVELETKLETEGFDKGCEKKKTNKFEPPYQNFTWTTTCEEIDFNLSQTAAQMAQKEDDDKSSDQQNQTNMITKMILQAASDYMGKSLRELHAEVTWMRGKQTRKVDATTHVARYDQPVAAPSAPAAGGATGAGGPGK
jgi:type II secretion system protein I